MTLPPELEKKRDELADNGQVIEPQDELEAERAITAKLQEDIKAQRASWMEERKLFSRDSSRMAKESNFLHAENAHLTSEIERLVKALEQIGDSFDIWCNQDDESKTCYVVAQQALAQHHSSMEQVTKEK